MDMIYLRVFVQMWEVIILVYCTQLLRLFIRQLSISANIMRFIHIYLFAMELCTCYVATSVFYQSGGGIAFFISRCLLNWVWYYVGGAMDVDVCVFIENFVRRTSTLKRSCIDSLVTFLGFKTAWRILHAVCMMTHSTEFEAHCDVVESCTTDLKVHFVLGILFEFTGTLLCRFYALHAEFNPPAQNIIYMTFFNNFINTVGLEVTGSYCNPLLSFVLVHHCDGHENGHFFLVYAVSPIMASLIALYCVLRSERAKRRMQTHPSIHEPPHPRENGHHTEARQNITSDQAKYSPNVRPKPSPEQLRRRKDHPQGSLVTQPKKEREQGTRS